MKFMATVLGTVVLYLGLAANTEPTRGPSAWTVDRTHVADTLSVDSANAIVQGTCARCHSDRMMRGNLTLEAFDAAAAVEDAEVAEKMIRKLRAGMMPPPGGRRPPEAALQGLATTLEARIDEAARARPNPGWRSFQRLNRAEYEHSIRELLDLRIDAGDYLPLDTKSANFDNIADVQLLSATLMEGYLRAASQVSRLAVGDRDTGPTTATYKVPKTASQMVRVEGAPFGSRGGISVVHVFPSDGEYVFQLEFHPGPTGFLYGLTSPDEELEVSIDGERVALVEIDRWMSESDPDGMRVETAPVHVRSGPRRVSAVFVKTFEGPVDDLITPVDHTLADTQIGSAYGVTTAPHLRDLAITGPFVTTGVSPTPSRQAIFSCRPTSSAEARPCAEEILGRLGSDAYRRPLTDDDLADLMAFYERGAAEGGFEQGIRVALEALLASPHFVFRFETTPADAQPGQIYRIADVDLASRLSFFLWATPPDEELTRLAREGRLSEPGVLEAQARRMLDDPRAEALATRFAAQWLRLQDLEKLHPDAQLYPYYDQTLADAMRRETELFFYGLVRDDRSVLELLTADYTFVNERLARHYGIPGVTGRAFRRVGLDDPDRRGLLGHGSILAMTSHANRTSPVLRGKWVMEVLLGTPPPPPPPDVPDLDETTEAEEGRLLTVRERLEEHRNNPGCRSCHRMMDPIGLALENFDVTGAWRIKDAGMPVDPSGELYDGTPLRSPVELRQALVDRPEPILRTFTENLMAYALGRRVEYYDMPTIRKITDEAAANDYRMSSFILGVIDSPAFQMSRAPETATNDPMEGG